MKELEFFKNHLYRFFCVSLLYCMTGFYIRDYFHFSLPNVVVLLLGVFWVCILQLFDQYKKTPIPYLILAVVITIFLVLLFQYNDQLWKAANDYYQWLCNMVLEQNAKDVGEGVALAYTLLSFCIVYLLCFPWYIITKIRSGRFLAAIFGAVSAILLTINEYEVNQMTAALYFTYLFLILMELSFLLQYRVDGKRSQEVTTFLIPMAAVILVLYCMLPTSSEPMRFQAIRNIWSQLSEYGNQIAFEFNLRFHPSKIHEFGLSFAGFSEDGSLGEEVNENSQAALVVKDLTRMSANMYLIGNVKNEFTGDSWIDTIITDPELSNYSESDLKMYELVNAEKSYYVPFSSQDIMDRRILDITFHDFTTKTFFCTENTAGFEPVRSVSEVVRNGGSQIFRKRPGYKAEYKIEALELRLGTESTDRFLIDQTSKDFVRKTENAVTLKALIDGMLKFSQVERIDNLDEVLAYRTQYIHENYSKLPENLSERVVTLAQTLTEQADSSYEKLKCLEAYLHTYAYTTRPPKRPQDKEFLDYFLFESKEGYCTYFATAMAIMSRCIGIPSRFVQGYCVPVNATDPEYEVTGNHAHAWMEAYLDGVGWITFEATPGYQDYLYHAKELYPSKSGTDSAFDYQALMEQMKHTEPVSVPVAVVEEEKTLTKGMTYTYAILIVIGIVVLALVLTGGYLFLRIRYSRQSYEKASLEVKLYILLRRIMYLFGRYEFCPEENPTLWQQFECASHKEEFRDQSTMEVAAEYMKLCYGDGQLNEEDRRKIVLFYENLLKYAKTQCKFWQYFLLLFRLARIKEKSE